MNSIVVSGQSPALERLIADSLVHSPWIAVTPNEIRIDWHELALRGGCARAVAQALQQVLPCLPLGAFHGAIRSGAAAPLAGTFVGPSVPVPANLHASFDELATLVDDALRAAERVLGSARVHSLLYDHLQAQKQKIQEVLAQARQPETGGLARISYDVRRRIWRAQDQMRAYLLGRPNEGAGAAIMEPRARAELASVWLLSGKLIRTQLDFYGQCEATVAAGAGNLFEPPDLWRKVADASARLASALAASVRSPYAPDCTAGFTDCRAIENFWGEGAGVRTVSPFASLRSALGVIDMGVQSVCSHPRLSLPVTRLIATMRQQLARESYPPAAEIDLQTMAQDIDLAMEELWARTPLLTLLTAGFLATFALPDQPEAFGFSLSPWLAALVLSKRVFGELPPAYLEPLRQDAEARSNSPTEAAPDDLSGDAVWERFLAADSREAAASS